MEVSFDFKAKFLKLCYSQEKLIFKVTMDKSEDKMQRFFLGKISATMKCYCTEV